MLVVEAYRTVPARDARRPEDLHPDWVRFTSSSTVENFGSLFGAERLRRARVASIGPISSATARRLGIEVAVEASSHTTAGVVEALPAFGGPGIGFVRANFRFFGRMAGGNWVRWRKFQIFSGAAAGALGLGEGPETAEGVVESKVRRAPIPVEFGGLLEGGEGVGSGAEDFGFEVVQGLEAVGGAGELEEQVVCGRMGGLELAAEVVEEVGEEGVVPGRRSGGAGAQAVAAGVLGGARLASGGTGPGGAEGVAAIGVDLGGRRHKKVLLPLF